MSATNQYEQLAQRVQERLPNCIKATVTREYYAEYDYTEIAIRAILRKPTWHDNLIALFFASPELVSDGSGWNAVIALMAEEIPSQVKSAAARAGWQRRRAPQSAEERQ